MLCAFTLQVATLMFAQMSVNVRSFMWSETKSQLYILSTSCERMGIRVTNKYFTLSEGPS